MVVVHHQAFERNLLNLFRRKSTFVDTKNFAKQPISEEELGN